MAEYQAIQIDRGQRVLLKFTMIDYVDPNTGVVTPAPNIQSPVVWTINLKLRKAYGQAEILTVAATVTGPQAFEAVLTGGASGNTDVESGDYVFDTWRVEAGSETPLDNGPFKINASRFGA